jgi:hypothetical protein
VIYRILLWAFAATLPPAEVCQECYAACFAERQRLDAHLEVLCGKTVSPQAGGMLAERLFQETIRLQRMEGYWWTLVRYHGEPERREEHLQEAWGQWSQ